VQAACSGREEAPVMLGNVRDQDVGALVRAVRVRRRLRQRDVAAAAMVPRECVSLVERGHGDRLTLARLRAVAAALEIRLELSCSWRGADGARTVNARHARLHELLAARLAALPGWEQSSEVTFSLYGERGVIDVLAWHGATRTLLVVELKTEIPDPAGLVAQVDRYRRLAPDIAAGRGWRPAAVAAWVVVADSPTNRRQLSRHRALLRNAFPLDGRALRLWLRDPAAAAAQVRGGGPGAPASSRPLAASGLGFLSDDGPGSTNATIAPTRRVRRRS